MNKTLLIFLLLVTSVYSQDDRSENPNVELPDFVITGQDVISIRRAEKLEPDFISIITQDFIKPDYPSENLKLRSLSNPIKENLDLLKPEKYYKGRLTAGAGIYITPEAGISYNLPFNNGILHAGFSGTYQRAYIENSDRYVLNGGAGIDYTIGMSDDVLSGTRFLLNGDYNSTSYKLFASTVSSKRTRNEGNYLLGVKNTTSKVFIFDISVKDNFTSLVEDKFTENLITTSGYAKVQLSDISFSVMTDYKKQFFQTDSLGSKDYDFIVARPAISFEILNSIKIGAGYSFAKSGSETFNNLYLSAGLKIYKDMILLGEFAPGAEFISSGSLLRTNDYFSAVSFTNLFYRKSNALNVSVKYEYEKYFQVDAGVKYFKSGNLPYFVKSNLPGQFNLKTTDVKNYAFYIDLLFHLGPYGFLYGNLEYTRLKDNGDNNIPYHPELNSKVTYGYELVEGLLGEASIDFNYNTYADIENTIKLNSYVDLGLKFIYKLNNMFILKLQMTNIFNRQIYKWQGYEEKPTDLLAGFELLFD